MLIEALTLEGYPYETASNGQEALDLLSKTQAPRLILLDMLMPVVDGRGVMRALNANPAERARHKVVCISAIHSLLQQRDLDPDATLAKPFTVNQLLSVLETMMLTDANTPPPRSAPPAQREEEFTEPVAHLGDRSEPTMDITPVKGSRQPVSAKAPVPDDSPAASSHAHNDIVAVSTPKGRVRKANRRKRKH
jgi:CheY-like chemotaxis protein